MNKEKDIIVPRWFLERIEDTLRIQYNINEPDMKETGESCQDRNIKQCLNGARKLLNGEELTGMERLEKLLTSTQKVIDAGNLLDEIQRRIDNEDEYVGKKKPFMKWKEFLRRRKGALLSINDYIINQVYDEY